MPTELTRINSDSIKRGAEVEENCKAVCRRNKQLRQIKVAYTNCSVWNCYLKAQKRIRWVNSWWGLACISWWSGYCEQSLTSISWKILLSAWFKWVFVFYPEVSTQVYFHFTMRFLNKKFTDQRSILAHLSYLISVYVTKWMSSHV